MNLGRKFRTTIACLVCCGLVAQQTPTFAGPPVAVTTATARVSDTRSESAAKATPAKKPAQPAAIDVELAEAGTLSGRVLDAQQAGVAESNVTIWQGKEKVAQTKTNTDGRFEVKNLRGGMYLVSSNNGYGLFRFWAPKSAPPAAHAQVLLMSKAVVVRAQNSDDGEVLYDDNGQPYARIHVVEEGEIVPENCPPVGSGGLCCLDCISLLLLATTTTAVVLLLLDDDDDDSESP